MSWWRCPVCARAMQHTACAVVTTPPIVKVRSGGVDQFSIGSERLTCPDHIGARLLPGRYATASEVRDVNA